MNELPKFIAIERILLPDGVVQFSAGTSRKTFPSWQGLLPPAWLATITTCASGIGRVVLPFSFGVPNRGFDQQSSGNSILAVRTMTSAVF